jgi:7-keto-8-aminopelargonate synthetase-like enzyme
LYVDEAHSIGALGKSARGVCDYWGVPTSDVDILMGTFTKSFGSVGGYIAASKDVVRHLRQHSLGSVYQSGMSLPCVQMILSALDVITGADGTDDGQRVRPSTAPLLLAKSPPNMPFRVRPALHRGSTLCVRTATSSVKG